MNQNCWAELEITPTNLDVETIVSFRGVRWSMIIRQNKLYLRALSVVHVEHSLEDRKLQDEHEKLLNGIVGHARNVIYFAFDVSIKWGYRSCNGDHLLSLYPSIHQQSSTESSSMTFSSPTPAKNIAILETIARTRKKGVKVLLNYSRRAQELDDLSYDAESFLNFYKLLECFYEVGKNSAVHKALLKRFTVKIGNKHIPQTSLRRYSYNQIFFATAVFSGVGYDAKLRRANLLYLLRIIAIRNNWNVGHKIFRSNPYDTYDAIGQHSDEFRYVMIENIYLEVLCKYFILKYINPKRFRLSNDTGMLAIEVV